MSIVKFLKETNYGDGDITTEEVTDEMEGSSSLMSDERGSTAEMLYN